METISTKAQGSKTAKSDRIMEFLKSGYSSVKLSSTGASLYMPAVNHESDLSPFFLIKCISVVLLSIG